jgi:serine/threonine-protein kinase
MSPAPPHEQPPELFELVKELGKGGFATTYRARVLDEELREEYGRDEVAIKVPLDRQKERVLRRELELNAGLHLRLKELQSAHLVRYLGFEVFRGQIVMVMEYLEEGSLRDLLRRQGKARRLPPEDAVRIAESVLRGLAVIHGEQVLHRDIKPENVLIQGQVAKIADFGIARMLESDKLAATQTGTLPYMSPEVLSGRGASFTSDVWSLGVTLYEMLSGRFPFGDDQTPIRIFVEKICYSDPRSVHELCPEVPRALSDIASRALRKDPAQRFSGAAEMADALAALRRGAAGGVEAELAAVRELAGDHTQAAEVDRRLRELIAKNPRDARVHQCRGEVHSRRQGYGEAIAAFKEAIALAPQSGMLHWSLALAFQGAGQRKEARASLDRALALDLDPSLRRHALMLRRALEGAP